MLFWSVRSYMFTSHFIIRATQVSGTSMEPTLLNGERYLLNHVVTYHGEYHPGDIVVLQLPGEAFLSVKRIIALPGELIQVSDGRVVINGRGLAEPYLDGGMRTLSRTLSNGRYRVASNSYFVMGDNREVSIDSRNFGAMDRDWIRGRVVLNEGWR
jgi:signal peptidase I